MPAIPGGISHRVRNLTICDIHENGWIDGDAVVNLPSMRNVQHLRFVVVKYAPNTPSGLWMEPTLEGIQSLQLLSLIIPNIDAALYFISIAAPSLKILHLGAKQSIFVEDGGADPPTLKLVEFPALVFLDLRCGNPFFYRITSDILATFPRPPIRSMTFPIHLTTWVEEDTEGMIRVSSMINAFAPTLEELHLFPDEWRVHGDVSFSRKLSFTPRCLVELTRRSQHIVRRRYKSPWCIAQNNPGKYMGGLSGFLDGGGTSPSQNHIYISYTSYVSCSRFRFR